MSDFNELKIEGNLVRDPEQKFVGEYRIANFTICCDYSRNKDKKELIFLDCVAWNELTDEILSYKKGEKLALRGKLKQDSWTAPDGQKKVKIKLNVLEVGFEKPSRKKKKNDEISEEETVSSDSGVF